MEIKSKAWQQNMMETRVHIEIEARYLFLLEIFKPYPALTQELTLFLKELCNPLRNWQVLVTEARKYCLDNLNILRSHPFGTRAVVCFIDLFHQGVECADTRETRQEAVDQLLQFLQRILREYGNEAPTILPGINRSLVRMHQYEETLFLLFVKSYYRLNRLATLMLNMPCGEITQWQPLNRVLFRYHQMNCNIWLLEEDPLTAFAKEAREPELPDPVKALFQPISHRTMETISEELEKMALDNKFNDTSMTARLMKLPEFNHIVSAYRAIPGQLLKAGKNSRQGNHWKVIFLFQIINIPDLTMIHDATLKEINTTLRWLIAQESSPYITQLILQTFTILKLRSHTFPEATLNAILNMGKGVYKTGDSDLVKFFIQCVIDAGFQFPDIRGVGRNWQVKSNKAHLLNIRVWLELISMNPHWSISLMSRLTIYLSICGVFIKDTDLFPRDITNLLNSPIEPVYNLLKQLTRLFPVYYNEIGAEGTIRDLSTRIDELTQRRDSLIHFYRKRIHVESSNRIITMTEAILHFWQTREIQDLLPYIPRDFTDQITKNRRYLDGVHEIIRGLVANGIDIPRDLLYMPEASLKEIIYHRSGDNGNEVDRERVMLLITLYRLLYQKYTPSCTEIDQYLAHINTARIPKFKILKEALNAQKDPGVKIKARLQKLLTYLELLKKELLSENRTQAREDIFKKRHFTADIPSLYGSYHEPKFDALGLTFRLESMVNPLFEQLIEELDLTLITKVTVHKIRNRLRMFYTALKLDGISSSEYEFQMTLLTHSLEVQGFSFTQYLDIFQSLTKAVQNIMNDYFHTVHQEHLEDALKRIPLDLLKEKYDIGDGLTHPDEQVAELFFRERMATSLGLQQLDLFLSKILTTLHQQAQELPQEHLQKLLMYDPKRILTSLTSPKSWILGAMDLGNKGNNLVTLSASCHLPVPPGFIITTEAFRYRQLIDSYPPALANFREQILTALGELEKTTGKTFGNPANPLLLSVRSGSVISQPGMMDTLIDVGINEEIARGIARKTGNGWLAWDNYRRFLQCIGMIQGMKRDDFDAVISEFKQKWKRPYKSLFSGDQMKTVALAYRDEIERAGIHFSNDPLEQLFQAIRLVFDSWDAPRARAYRQIIGLSQDWGTSVTVQQMVFGNISQEAGTGVIITHDPRSPRNQISLWGDFTRNNQGEDVVAGLVNTFPISIAQQEREMRNTDTTLESHFPEIYNGLLNWADILINKRGWSPQEIEFTFEGPHLKNLYILQSRDLGIRERKTRPLFKAQSRAMAKSRYLGHGIGVSGGAMSGRLVFTLEDIHHWRTLEPETALILVRNDTVPDDIREIHAADGLLTARGGMTSHASIVAYRLDKTCVVGYRNMICNEQKKECRFEDIILTSGDFISIDGHKGAVFRGSIDMSHDQLRSG